MAGSRAGRSRDTLAVVGLVLSAAALFISPGLVTIGFYMPIFSMMAFVDGSASPSSSFASFPSFGAWAVVPIVLTLPGLVMSLIALTRARRDTSSRGVALAGVIVGAVALIAVTGFTLFLYSNAG